MPFHHQLAVQARRLAIQAFNDIDRNPAGSYRIDGNCVVLIMLADAGFQSDNVAGAQDAQDALGAIDIQAIQFNHAAANRIQPVDFIALLIYHRARSKPEILDGRLNQAKIFIGEIGEQ